MTPDEIRACKRRIYRERERAKPGFAERDRERKRAAYAAMKADPERHAAHLAAKRERWARMKDEDPERYARRLEAMRAYSAAARKEAGA